MVPLFTLGVALMVGAVLLVRWYATASAASVARTLRWSVIALVLAVALGLLLTGKLMFAVFALLGLLPAAFRWLQIYRAARTFARGGRPSGGQRSRVETATLSMALDHDSGEMVGVVLSGPFTGRMLSDLSQDELLSLLEACRRDDPQGAALLETWLDRYHGQAWRGGDTGGRRTGPAPSASMDRNEAYRILGLEAGADEAAIKRAHRELITRFHPDQGGSDYLAAKINQAKEVLLGD